MPPQPLELLVCRRPASRAGQLLAAALAPFAPRLRVTLAVDEAFRERLPEAEIVAVKSLPPADARAAVRLRWLASWAAGLDDVASPELVARGVAITNASGVHGPNIAEHVLAMMLMFARKMPRYLRHQAAGEWRRDVTGRDDESLFELDGQTLLIVGLGRLGLALAARAHAFGLRVVGVRRAASPSEPLPPGVHAILGADDLDAALGEAHHVVLALPATRETHHLVDARRLARFRPGAYLYNVGRGSLVDEAALVEALASGRLGGAGLDVFETEPLPAASPLWRLENVIVTPHVAGVTPRYFERFAPILAENVRRFLDGEELLNRYRPERGY